MEKLNPIPKGLQTSEAFGVTLVNRRWYSPPIWAKLAFAALWNGLTWDLYWKSLEPKAHKLSALPLALIFNGIGLFLIYSTIAGFFNRTEIRIGNGKFVVRHGPFPWGGNIEIDTNDIRQMFCDEKWTSSKKNPTVTYRVNAVMHDGRKEVLVADLPERDQALYLAEIAEKLLGLSPIPVVGELG